MPSVLSFILTKPRSSLPFRYVLYSRLDPFLCSIHRLRSSAISLLLISGLLFASRFQTQSLRSKMFLHHQLSSYSSGFDVFDYVVASSKHLFITLSRYRGPLSWLALLHPLTTKSLSSVIFVYFILHKNTWCTGRWGEVENSVDPPVPHPITD